MQVKLLLLSLLILFQACKTNSDATTKSLYDAQGRKVDESTANSSIPAWHALTPSEGITGIGALGVTFGVVDPDVCTAFLIDTGVPSAPAYAVTNAHCNFFQHLGTDMLKANEFRTDRKTDYFIVLNHFVSVPESKRQTIPFKRLAYITESTTDVAIFETTKSIAEVTRMGFRPLKLRPTRPKLGDRMRLVGIPLRTSTYDQQSLHISSCNRGDEVALRNGIYSAPQSVKHKCSSIPGFSGGPLLGDDGTVVLLNSHGTDDFSNDKPCTYETMPCEVRANGQVVVDKDMNYGQYVDGIAACFTKGVFDLSPKNCTLPK